MGAKKGFTLLELLIVIIVILIIAAIAIPQILRNRIRANQAAAVTAIKSYTASQVIFQNGKFGENALNTNTGSAGFCDNFRNLYFGVQPQKPDVNLELTSRPFSNAYARDPGLLCAITNRSVDTPSKVPVAYNGYLFAEPKELILAGVDPVNKFENDYALVAVPFRTGSTGEAALWVGQQGFVYQTQDIPDSYDASIEIDTPSNPTATAKWKSL